MILTHSAEETRTLGRRLARQLQRGDVVLLQGDLGAGKSELARGVARGLGINGPVPSPSFTILNAYDEGELPLYHFDWYRLESAQEIYEMGMDEMLAGDGIALIEWSERAKECLPARYLEIFIHSVSENVRQLSFAFHGDFSFSEEHLL